MTGKRTLTTKDVFLLYQLYKNGQLELTPEFQRNGIWPRAAKAYLIDTILNDRAIPLLFMKRQTNLQKGGQTYQVIDGQQRLRAIFDFLDNRFSLTESLREDLRGKKFKALTEYQQAQLLQYDLVVEELSGYSEDAIRDLFVRMNRYVVKLSPQEIRHAHSKGAFREVVEEVTGWEFWRRHKIVSDNQKLRYRLDEICAEYIILVLEGPQDKKQSIDLYYERFHEEKVFSFYDACIPFLLEDLNWLGRVFDNIGSTRFSKPIDLYGLIGALELMRSDGIELRDLSADLAAIALLSFEQQIEAFANWQKSGMTAENRPSVSELVGRYYVAASRQTDNIRPRETRISVLSDILQVAVTARNVE